MEGMAPADQQRMVDMVEGMQTRDSLRMYNRLVERCFSQCVTEFRRKNLDSTEERVSASPAPPPRPDPTRPASARCALGGPGLPSLRPARESSTPAALAATSTSALLGRAPPRAPPGALTGRRRAVCAVRREVLREVPQALPAGGAAVRGAQRGRRRADAGDAQTAAGGAVRPPPRGQGGGGGGGGGGTGIHPRRGVQRLPEGAAFFHGRRAWPRTDRIFKIC